MRNKLFNTVAVALAGVIVTGSAFEAAAKRHAQTRPLSSVEIQLKRCALGEFSDHAISLYYGRNRRMLVSHPRWDNGIPLVISSRGIEIPKVKMNAKPAVQELRAGAVRDISALTQKCNATLALGP